MKTSVKKSVLRNRQLRIESLEERQLLSVNPLGIDDDTTAVYAAAVPEIAAAAPAGVNVSDWNIIESQGLNKYTMWSGINGEQRATNIDVANRGLTGSLNVSGLTNLYVLNCSDNQLTSLDVSGCTSLRVLHCDDNQLTSLDVSGLTNLQRLYAQSNKLKSLDASGCTDMQTLWCGTNELTSLDVSGCTNLTSLSFYDSRLTTLDVSSLKNLQSLVCSDNQLTTLDVSALTNLQYLSCSGNQLTSLDISALTNLQTLSCSGNQLASLDVSSLTNLRTLGCNDNKLTSLDVSALTNLEFLDCCKNNLTTVYVPIGYAGICNKDEGVELIEKAAPVTKPTAPKNLTAKVLPVSNGKLPVQINWDAASNATHYILHRWEEGDYKADGKTKNWKVIYAMKPAGQIPSGGLLSDFQVINSDVSKVTAKRVQYLVRGYNGDIPGESVNIFVTLDSTPAAPKNLTAKVLPMSNGKLPVQINWNAAAGATHYILHRWEEGDYKADGKTKNWKVIYAMKPAGQIPSGDLLSDFQVINSDVSKVTAKQVQYLVRGYNGDVPGESASVFVTVN